MLQSRTVPIDYFGVAGNNTTQLLLGMDSNKKLRKSAFNNMERLAKAAGLIPKNGEQVRFALTINQAGAQQLEFLYMVKEGT